MALNGICCASRIRRDRQRAEQHQRGRRHAAPVAVEPAFADAHDRAGEAEAQHGEAHHQRSEMRPAPDREDAHDANLQRDHRPGLETDGEIEPRRRLEVEIEVRPRGLGQRHGPHQAKNSNDWDFTGILAGRGCMTSQRPTVASNTTPICRPWGRRGAGPRVPDERASGRGEVVRGVGRSMTTGVNGARVTARPRS